MLNRFIDVNRIEFLATKRCNANCRHCSVPINSDIKEHGYADIQSVEKSFRFLLENYNITSTMVYGGEPLLFIDAITGLFRIAEEYLVPSIDLITSGFVSRNTTHKDICVIADKLSASGVKRILLSTDAFHQERIPIEYVEEFLDSVLQLQFCELLLHPAWLVTKDDDNPHNTKTREILEFLSKKYSVGISGGNYIIPSGNNKRYIGRFYEAGNIQMDKCGEIPYTNPLDSIKSLRILPDGNINICRGMTIGNIFNQNIKDVLYGYHPEMTTISKLAYMQGVKGIYDFAVEHGAVIAPGNYFGTCDFCSDCIHFLKENGIV